MKWFRREPRPEFAARYIEASRRPLKRRTPFGAVRFVALDAETTGFAIGKDRVLSLSILPLHNGRLRLVEMADWLVYQQQPAPNEATAIHGILPEETRHGTPEAEVVRSFLPLLEGAVLVGHHVRFDAAMLDEMMRRTWGLRMRNQMVDTAQMAMRELVAFHRTGYGNQRPPALDEVCAQLDLPMVERHTAAGDTFTTAELFLLLAGRMRRRLGREPLLQDLPLERL